MSSLIRSYENFIRNNKSVVETFDQLARLGIVLGLESENTEWETETAYTGLNLLNYYHDSILHKDAENEDPRSKAQYYNDEREPDPEHYRRFHEGINKKFSKYFQVLQYLEVFIEMTSEKFSRNKKNKWVVVLMIELAKSLIRMYLLVRSKGRIYIDYFSLKNTYAARAQELEALRRARKIQGKKVLTKKKKKWKGGRGGTIGKRSGAYIPDVFNLKNNNHQRARFDDEEYEEEEDDDDELEIEEEDEEFELAAPQFTRRDLQRVQSIRQRYQTTMVTGELLYILRPVIYVLCLIKWGTRSWKPWTISLMIEAMSRATTARLPEEALTAGEKDELNRRVGMMVYYLFRSPFFDKFVKPPTNFMIKKCENIPLVSHVLVNVLEYMMALQSYYFYTSQ